MTVIQICVAIVVIAWGVAFLGWAIAAVCAKAIKDAGKAEIAAEVAQGFLFFVCLPYWIYKKIKDKQTN